jgi:pyruvate dehydrogenase phosphatase
MGNSMARLATPCFAPPDDAHHDTAGAADDDGTTGVCHVLSFDGRIHGVLLPSNQSTAGGSVLLTDRASFSGSSSFDSSNSFSFRTLQPRQYSGPLDGGSSSSSASTSATNSGVSSVPRRTDDQILADLYATRHRRQQQASSPLPLLGGLRRAVASLLRAGPCVPPSPKQEHAAAKVQWARGKAGEDRVHVVVSEEHGWMFVGVYDGFNGPDATDYLVAHLYAAVCRELDGVLRLHADEPAEAGRNGGGRALAGEQGRHHDVLDALARALRSTEAGYFAEAEARAAECPELAMVGSCVLVALVKGADVYVMNVGDSRAVLAQRAEPEPDLSRALVAPRQGGGGVDLAGVKDEIRRQFDACETGDLAALQLTMDHSTSVYKVTTCIRSRSMMVVWSDACVRINMICVG